MKANTVYTPRGHRDFRARQAPRPLMPAVLARLKARQVSALAVRPRPAKEIARAVRHQATRELGGRWHV